MKSDSILGVYDAYKHELREINLDKVKRGEMNFPVVFKDTYRVLSYPRQI